MVARTPLVLLPGMACDARVWDERIVAALARRAETRFVDVLAGSSVAAMAARVLDDAPERFAVCGFSQGGIVALELATRAPDRVLGVGAIACSARAPTAAQRLTWATLDGHARKGDIDAVVDALLPSLLRSDSGDQVRSLVRRMAHAVGATALREQVAAQQSRPDRLGELERIACPSVIVAARDDAACPIERVAEVARAIPNAELRVVDDAGHLCTLTRPQAVARHLGYWIEMVASASFDARRLG